MPPDIPLNGATTQQSVTALYPFHPLVQGLAIGGVLLLIGWFGRLRLGRPRTVTLYSPGTGASGQIYNVTGSSDLSATTESLGETGVTILNDAATTAGDTYRAHAVAQAQL